MSKFTPGPWYTDIDDFHDRCIYDSEGNWLANATSCDESPEAIARAEADTLLISAAPDMYEALMMVRDGGGTISQIRELVVQSLAKADGK